MFNIPEDTEVWIRSGNKLQKGRVVAHANEPRSYIVNTPTGRLRRNRSHLQVVPDSEPKETESEISDPMVVQSRIVTRSQTGTLVRRPDRFSPGREM